jgi:hypothetical protein
MLVLARKAQPRFLALMRSEDALGLEKMVPSVFLFLLPDCLTPLWNARLLEDSGNIMWCRVAR